MTNISNNSNRLTGERLKRLLAQRKEKAASESKRGKIVGSYYSSEDLAILRKWAEKQGISPGGFQHDVVLLTLNMLEETEHEIKPEENPAVLELQQKTAELEKAIQASTPQAKESPAPKGVIEELREMTARERELGYFQSDPKKKTGTEGD